MRFFSVPIPFLVVVVNPLAFPFSLSPLSVGFALAVFADSLEESTGSGQEGVRTTVIAAWCRET